MKTSIRNKRFTMGIILFLIIILLLFILSAYFLNKLSNKTSAILKENHYSVVYVRNMSNNLTNINIEITKSYINNKQIDNELINREISLFLKSLNLEKNNITEVGEEKLVTEIEACFKSYIDLLQINKCININSLQNKYSDLYNILIVLSQMNEKAIEAKTEDAKISAKNATTQMSFIGALCFLIAYGFTFSFSSYFNERFFQLYKGIKDISSGEYGNRISIKGNDEINEISIIFNEMAEKLSRNNKKMILTLQEYLDNEIVENDVDELKKVLNKLKNIEEEATKLISKLENKK